MAYLRPSVLQRLYEQREERPRIAHDIDRLRRALIHVPSPPLISIQTVLTYEEAVSTAMEWRSVLTISTMPMPEMAPHGVPALQHP